MSLTNFFEQWSERVVDSFDWEGDNLRIYLEQAYKLGQNEVGELHRLWVEKKPNRQRQLSQIVLFEDGSGYIQSHYTELGHIVQTPIKFMSFVDRNQLVGWFKHEINS